MDSNLWKLNARNASEFAKDIQLSLYNQEPDQLSFDVDGEPFDSAALYAYGDSISLYKGTVRKFAGKVIAGPRFGSPTMENHAYEATGLWWHLEELSYEQTWTAVGVPQTHVTLGRDDDNEIITIGAQIKAALDFAITTKGAPFTYVAAELTALDATPPTDEQTDVACSEVIRKMLRWVPDCVAWFDYAPATPILHFTRRAAATAVQFPIIGDTEQIDIRDRADLIKSGIIINYERTDTIDGEQIPTMQQDIFPIDTVSGFNTLTFTINIAGQQIATQSTKVEVTSFASYGDVVRFFRKDLEGVVLTTTILHEPALPSIVISGMVPEWANETAEDDYYELSFEYTDADGSNKTEDATFNVVATDAESTTFTREISATDAEPYPTGLAESLYNALSIKHWQGQFTLVEEEVSASVHPGQILNLTGGLADWATMAAVIQRVSFQVDTGRTAIEFGPPERLGLTDYIDLLNANRSRITHYSSDARKSGKSSSGGDLDVGGATPNSSGSGTSRYSKLVLDNGAEAAEKKTVTIDSSTIAAGKVLAVNAAGQDTEWGEGLPAATEGEMVIKGDTPSGWIVIPAANTDGYILNSTVDGAEWAAPITELPIAAEGDLIVKGAAFDWIVLSPGTDGYHLASNGTTPEWVAPELPAGSDGDLIQYDSASGKWAAVSLAEALGLSSAGDGVLMWDNGFWISDTCSGGYVRS